MVLHMIFFQILPFLNIMCLILSSWLIITLFLCENISYFMIFGISNILLKCVVTKDKHHFYISFCEVIDIWKILEMKPSPLPRTQKKWNIKIWGVVLLLKLTFLHEYKHWSGNKWIKFDRQASNNNSVYFLYHDNIFRCFIWMKFKNSSKMKFITSNCI